MIEIKNLHVEIETDEGMKPILKGLNLKLDAGEVHALMGPNGSGKSTLAGVLMGDPRYKITQGSVIFNGEDITEMPVDEKAKKGIFLSFQNPIAVPGVNIRSFLRQAYNSIAESKSPKEKEKMSVLEFNEFLMQQANLLKIPSEFLDRYLNEGFSGGEKKKFEILQLMVLNPELAILDETDSGLDIDALRVISEGVNKFMQKGGKTVLIITHYKRILGYIKPSRVSIMLDGKIATTGAGELVDQLEEKGYGWIQED